MFEQELQFWGIKDDTPNELRFWQNFRDQALIEMFLEEPGEVHGEEGERGGELVHMRALKTWKELGPIKIVDIVRNSQIKIDFILDCIKREFLKGSVVVYGQDLQEKVAGQGNQPNLGEDGVPKENKILEDYLNILDQQQLNEQQNQDQDVDATFGGDPTLNREQLHDRN